MTVKLSKIRHDTNATYTWLDGHTERVRVVSQPQHDRVWIEWPESVRTVLLGNLFPPSNPCNEGITVLRPGGWVDRDRVVLD